MRKNTTKVDTSFAGKEDLRMVKEAQDFKDSRGEAPLVKANFFDSIPQSFAANEFTKNPFPSCTIHEFGEDDDDLDFEKT